MAARKDLLELNYLVDDDTGMYHVGEIDFGIHSGALEDYLLSYGYEGKKEIVAMLGHLIYEVEDRWKKMQPQGQVAKSA